MAPGRPGPAAPPRPHPRRPARRAPSEVAPRRPCRGSESASGLALRGPSSPATVTGLAPDRPPLRETRTSAGTARQPAGPARPSRRGRLPHARRRGRRMALLHGSAGPAVVKDYVTKRCRLPNPSHRVPLPPGPAAKVITPADAKRSPADAKYSGLMTLCVSCRRRPPRRGAARCATCARATPSPGLGGAGRRR